jgi:hypothetical protein
MVRRWNRKLRNGSKFPSHAYSSNEVPCCWDCNQRRGRFTWLLAKLHRLEHIRNLPGVPRDKMIECERKFLSWIGAEFVEIGQLSLLPAE